ncbi:trigger factor (peptidyl-prolyl cis /trans isomerase, chaperone) [Campylobacter iguaniorum]|uniref:Trigger factor n=1 Tax=Campylobacter iguaniorum TaxID=1244531 RepID=A0A076FAZ4_9BACT|nr:trigger factor [Campylobacter iguaniorum]AII15405.1 trigger factor (peptidyl-prolyl cis /trans isomerase, chaperone) [Campylobacter iguaniorum]ALV25335.1 trigger factor (peptidyl-prolyl cis /trans isomerase, chaperone) [Campylobacter iguaniorum]
MEVKAQLLNPANATATTQIKADELNAKVENLAKKAAKNIKIDGFRKGKVPTAEVLKRYGGDLQNDARNEFFKDIINACLVDINKKADEIIGEPMVLKFDEKDGNIDVEIEISFKPEVKVDGYEELISDYATPRVTKKEIEDKVNEFLLMMAPVEKVEKDVLEKGDWAKFNFEGFVDGVAFEGGKAEDYVLEIGSNQFIPGFEDGMIGLKVGEEKDVNVTFPKEYGAAHLAGKPAVFKVKLLEIQGKKVGELDEKTLKALLPTEENPTAAKLEEKIKEQIRNEKFQKLLNEELKPKFADKAVEKFKFDLPKNIVEQEMDMQFRNAWGNFSEDERKKFSEDRDAAMAQRETYADEAKKSVALTFIIDELAKVRGVSVSDQELLQAVYFEAYRYGIDPKKHLEDYKNQGMLPAVKMAMIEEKLFNNLFKKDAKDEKGE